MPINVFQESTKALPKSDSQICRVMKENEIAGRTDHMPKESPATEMSIKHVPNAGSRT